MNREFKLTHQKELTEDEKYLDSCARNLSANGINSLKKYRLCEIAMRLRTGYYYRQDSESTAPLTLTQMLEAAQAKGILWTNKWPTKSGWYPATHIRNVNNKAKTYKDKPWAGSWLSYINVDTLTMSETIHYGAVPFDSTDILALPQPLAKVSELVIAEPWWLQS